MRNPNPCSIELTDVTKEFPENGIIACKGITLSVHKGEILCLMGENGAGKSTLMHILSGFYTPTGGTVGFPGNETVGMIHQKPILAGSLAVWENIALGHKNGSFKIKPAQQKEKIRRIQDKYDLPLNLNRMTYELSAAQVQRAELLEALVLDRQILVFDEPSASLTDQQAESLMRLIKRLKAEGRTILYITHRIQESFALADRIGVLRKGELKLISPVSSLSPGQVSQAMIGAGNPEKNGEKTFRGKASRKGEALLKLEDLSYDEQGASRLKNINADLYGGEILGIAGIRENGLTYLEDLITGAIRPKGGRFLLKGKPIPYLTPYRFRKHGISYIPADRLTRGASLESTLGENLILLKRKLKGSGKSYKTRLRSWAVHLIKKAEIAGHPDQPVKTLSGGNIQKMILTRELHEEPSLLIISEPSWGLDFASREKLHKQILKARDQGAAVLLLTTDIDELLFLSDRIAVLTAGELTHTPPEEGVWTRRTIGERMTGADLI